MKITYPAGITEKDGKFIVEGVEPLGNFLTYGDTLQEAIRYAQDALTGILGSMLDHGDEIPDAPVGRDAEKDIYWIEPDPGVAVPILIRKTRLEVGMTQGELARKAGVSYQQIQRWERSGTNPTLSSLKKVFSAMGRPLELEVA